MPRLPRVFLPGHPVHVVQRGNNRGQVFFRPGDAQKYLGWLQEAAGEHGLAVHAYVLMINHIHLLVSPETAHARYRASLVDADAYFFACMRYIELNPVRAGMAQTPRDYRWSSYKANAEAKADALITPHQLYTDLAATPEARAEAYRSLFEGALGEDALGAIRGAINGGWPLGAERFMGLVSRHAGQSMRKGRRGRPQRKPI